MKDSLKAIKDGMNTKALSDINREFTPLDLPPLTPLPFRELTPADLPALSPIPPYIFRRQDPVPIIPNYHHKSESHAFKETEIQVSKSIILHVSTNK